jgi:mRNA deadenylase 3'-5' endonuclease subunit Ccr4
MSESKTRISVYQYNVLSQTLANPSFMTGCKLEDLDPNLRLWKTLALLEEPINNEAIICLQEVSKTWYGNLHDFFSNHNYKIIHHSYGKMMSDSMGVAIAYPSNKYSTNNTSISQIGSTIQVPPPPILNTYTRFTNWYNGILRCIPIIKYYAPRYKKRFCPYEYAKGKSNTSIMTTFCVKSTDQRFCLATYHMPCAFWAPTVMELHTKKLIEEMDNYKGKYPVIISGDFNFQPDSSSYKIMTKRYKSSYKELTGEDPITNQTQTVNNYKLFKAPLDYIFYNERFHPIDVKEVIIPDRVSLPDKNNPSDHAPLYATLELD